MIAVVSPVIAASILSGSMLNEIGSISTKTGRMLFQSSEWAVATNEYGVVMTSPLTRNACSATISAMVPFENSERCSTPR